MDDFDLGDHAERGQQFAIRQPTLWLAGGDPDLGFLRASDLLAFPQTFESDQDLLAELESLIPKSIAVFRRPTSGRPGETPPGER